MQPPLRVKAPVASHAVDSLHPFDLILKSSLILPLVVVDPDEVDDAGFLHLEQLLIETDLYLEVLSAFCRQFINSRSEIAQKFIFRPSTDVGIAISYAIDLTE